MTFLTVVPNEGERAVRRLSAYSMEKVLDSTLSQAWWHALTVLELEDVPKKETNQTSNLHSPTKLPRNSEKCFSERRICDDLLDKLERTLSIKIKALV